MNNAQIIILNSIISFLNKKETFWFFWNFVKKWRFLDIFGDRWGIFVLKIKFTRETMRNRQANPITNIALKSTLFWNFSKIYKSRYCCLNVTLDLNFVKFVKRDTQIVIANRIINFPNITQHFYIFYMRNKRFCKFWAIFDNFWPFL